jgi:hypothetical protein
MYSCKKKKYGGKDDDTKMSSLPKWQSDKKTQTAQEVSTIVAYGSNEYATVPCPVNNKTNGEPMNERRNFHTSHRVEQCDIYTDRARPVAAVNLQVTRQER